MDVDDNDNDELTTTRDGNDSEIFQTLSDEKRKRVRQVDDEKLL